MTSSGWRSEAPKIVQIETRYVETDALNFKAVVQSLTGKNASTAWVGNAGSSVAAGSEIKGGIAIDGVTAKPEEVATNDRMKNNLVSSMVLMNMSFKDLDRMLSE